jgi:hypothetical protein
MMALHAPEFKQLIKTLHENGLRVVMDVVYNHTMLIEHRLSINWFPAIITGKQKMANFPMRRPVAMKLPVRGL